MTKYHVVIFNKKRIYSSTNLADAYGLANRLAGALNVTVDKIRIKTMTKDPLRWQN